MQSCMDVTITSLKDSLLRMTSSALYIRRRAVSVLWRLRRTHTGPGVQHRAEALTHRAEADHRWPALTLPSPQSCRSRVTSCTYVITSKLTLRLCGC